MHVVMIEVAIDASRQDEVMQFLHDTIVPSSKAAPGFVKGAWLQSADLTKGHSVMWFDDESNAKAMVDGINASPSEPGDPVAVRSAELYTVRAEV